MRQTEYREEYGEIRIPDGFAEELKGKSIEEQAKYYGIRKSFVNEMSYHLMAQPGHQIPVIRSEEYFDCAIVKQGMVVGFMKGEKAFLPYCCVSSQTDSDNNGAGYKESTTYYYLVCLSADISRPVCDLPPFGAPEHQITVPVTEVDFDAEFSEEFLAQIKGKSIAEQLDYYQVGNANRGIQKQAEKSTSSFFYRTDLMTGIWGVPLRYDHKVNEIFVKDGLIVGVSYRYCVPEYDFDACYTIKIGERTTVWKSFGVDESGVENGLFYCWCLQPIVYH